MKVNVLGDFLFEAVFKAYEELDRRELTLEEQVAVRAFLDMTATAIAGGLQGGC